MQSHCKQCYGQRSGRQTTPISCRSSKQGLCPLSNLNPLACAALLVSREAMVAGLVSVRFSRTSATTPATNGTACDVPVRPLQQSGRRV